MTNDPVEWTHGSVLIFSKRTKKMLDNPYKINISRLEQSFLILVGQELMEYLAAL